MPHQSLVSLNAGDQLVDPNLLVVAVCMMNGPGTEQIPLVVPGESGNVCSKRYGGVLEAYIIALVLRQLIHAGIHTGHVVIQQSLAVRKVLLQCHGAILRDCVPHQSLDLRQVCGDADSALSIAVAR